MNFVAAETPARTGFGSVAILHQSTARCNQRRLRDQRRLDRIRAYVEANLSDPDLSPRIAARALGMSVRSLHLALAPSGETFGQLLQRRRLQACHALLCRPEKVETIADIAFGCGFNSLSSFYRAFRRVFGACPRDLAGDSLPLAA
jgi:AraC-like DNA-binding protein